MLWVLQERSQETRRLCLRFTDGFRNIPWTLAFVVCIGLSMYFLQMATRTAIPLGTGYAVWTGIGALGTVAIGMLFFMNRPRCCAWAWSLAWSRALQG
jgi:multidrug transporter EmrE-like cation transporter